MLGMEHIIIIIIPSNIFVVQSWRRNHSYLNCICIDCSMVKNEIPIKPVYRIVCNLGYTGSGIDCQCAKKLLRMLRSIMGYHNIFQYDITCDFRTMGCQLRYILRNSGCSTGGLLECAPTLFFTSVLRPEDEIFKLLKISTYTRYSDDLVLYCDRLLFSSIVADFKPPISGQLPIL